MVDIIKQISDWLTYAMSSLCIWLGFESKYSIIVFITTMIMLFLKIKAVIEEKRERLQSKNERS